MTGQAAKTAAVDRPEILAVLFHPRNEAPEWRPPQGAQELRIPVTDGIELGGRCHPAGPESPNLLFFHGNGEIVADYDDIGQAYASSGITFLAVDYRGYGRSDGTPTASALMADSRAALDWVRQWLRTEERTGPLAVMGRSLGSAAALEVARSRPTEIDALIIESGFAHTGPLLHTLGAGRAASELKSGDGFNNRSKIAACRHPTLIIHAELDHLIPLSEGQTLFEASPAGNKKMLTIPGANHNDIFMRAWPTYRDAVVDLLAHLSA